MITMHFNSTGVETVVLLANVTVHDYMHGFSQATDHLYIIGYGCG